ncbi:MAG TPA: phosphate/phosphite/phosphonate ABC transporter substrate-binding protein, partial [Tepidisphaeraceae bacterium]|nr:phosphate/phosphite/phosphonate ABC transporter substrate-binding protein [Tepidisphaeraceae bacterium]
VVMQVSGLENPVTNKLDERFTDANGDGLADTPADPSKLIDPPTLKFSYVATETPEAYRDVFKEFVAYLSKQTGKTVEYEVFASNDDELRAMRDGKLQIAGLNTGNVSTAVNLCGFIPVATLAQADDNRFIHTAIIVPSDSPIHSVSDLKGQVLTLTEIGSNSGFKAPLVSLRKDHGLVPGRDYQVIYSGGHDQSIRGIASKKFKAAAVASDLLDRALAHDEIKKDQYRTIFESASYPPATFGYVYNLKPELTDKIKQAMLSFNFAGTAMEKEFAPAKQVKLIAVDYKKDFDTVRKIEDATGTVQEIREPSSGPSATTQPTTSATARAQ